MPAAAVAVPSTIQHVEIFPSGAAISRSVAVPASEERVREVRIEGLPGSLVASSIQLRPEDAEALQIGGFRFLSNENPVKPDDPRTRELRDQLEHLDTQLREVREERARIEARISHFEGLAQSIKESLKEEAKAESYDLALKAWESLEEVRSDGQARLAELAKRQEDLQRERNEVQEDFDEQVQELSKLSGVLVVDVIGATATEAPLELNYQIREAGWNPVHEIRAQPEKGTVKWVYKASIRQQTGEDWKNVPVTLKSISALYAGDLPELPPIFLHQAADRQESKMAAFSVRSADVAGAPPAQMEMAQPESTTASFFMKLPEPLSLVSGREAVVREAFSKELQTEFWSQSVPELSNEAWLMAGTTNELGWPILGGEAYAYIDGQLVARKFLPGYGVGEEIELALGKNEKIAVERHERKRKEAEGGLIDRTKRHEIKYETIVTNNMAVAHRVVLEDRFPIGRDNKIQVRQISPKGVEPEEGTGLFKWETTLSPGATESMVTEYTVTYPAEWTVFPKL